MTAATFARWMFSGAPADGAPAHGAGRTLLMTP
jgi:hypothetical protein